jgi:hypothetical protein
MKPLLPRSPLLLTRLPPKPLKKLLPLKKLPPQKRPPLNDEGEEE